MSGSAHWHRYAAKLAPERRGRFPGSMPRLGRGDCSLHEAELGPPTHICRQCHEEAWAWTAERYLIHLAQQQPPVEPGEPEQISLEDEAA
jgi:hypothetical protein